MKTKHYLCAVSVAGLLFAALSSQGSESVVTPAMAGHWEGNAQIIMAWCQATNLPLSIDIQSDGSVTGRIGDASLVKGRLKRNRGWLGRKLDLATDYIIKGDLSGPIVAAEGIQRDGISIPLNFNTNTFSGGVHTSGSMFGGREKMILSAGSLELQKK